MAQKVGYYSGKNGLPGKLLGEDICSICGNKVHHLEEEDIKPGLVALMLYQLIKGDKQIELSCGHKYHQDCIRGWTILGKNSLCPYCNEKVEPFKATNPWETTQQQYINMLDYFRVLVTWNPLVFVICHFTFKFLGLS